MEGALRAVRAMAVLASVLAAGHIAAAATKADLEREVQRFSVACAKNEMYPDLYDCRCLTEGYRKGVQAADSTRRRKAIVRDNKLLQQCPASQSSIAAWFKHDCSTSLTGRPDHADLCNCGAEKFSTAFRASPPESKREIEILKKDAMQACGLAEQKPARHPMIPLK